MEKSKQTNETIENFGIVAEYWYIDFETLLLKDVQNTYNYCNIFRTSISKHLTLIYLFQKRILALK